MRKHLSTAILVVLLLVGLALLLYPTVSNYLNERNASQLVAAYDAKVAELSEQDQQSAIAVAEAYNRALAANPDAFSAPEVLSGYDEALDVTGTGVMGYVTVEKIGVRLPIYHGTSDGVLAIGAGHLEGTSLPVGGAGTHAVILGHRGLPSAKLFTDLDKLEVGDTFSVTVLDRTLTYEVDKISIVLPSDTSLLRVVDGQDLCTLFTCTPYGVNSHRLLVRGHRVENAADLATRISSDGEQVGVPLVALTFFIPLSALVLAGTLVYSIRTRRPQGAHFKR